MGEYHRVPWENIMGCHGRISWGVLRAREGTPLRVRTVNMPRTAVCAMQGHKVSVQSLLPLLSYYYDDDDNHTNTIASFSF